MRLKQLQLTNFMGFDALDVPLDHPMVILIAENGIGKSSVLKAARVAIGSWLLGIDDLLVRAPSIKVWMIRHHLTYEGFELVKSYQGGAKITATGTIGGRSYKWSRGLKIQKGSRTTRSGAKELKSLASTTTETSPLLAYYGAHKRFTEPKSLDSTAPATRTAAYADCLEGPINLTERLRRWKRLKLQAADRDDAKVVYEALNTTLTELLPGVEKVWFDTDHDAPMVKFHGHTSGGGLRAFPFLSDGFKNILVIGLDLALRAIQLNPALGREAIVETEGVVLIDELDQHLHPAWQTDVASGLRRAFPKLQFILSTHSPLVAQSAPEDAQIVVLRVDERGASAKEVDQQALGPTFDTALRSSAFELSTTWSPAVQSLMKERVKLSKDAETNHEALNTNAAELDRLLQRPVLDIETQNGSRRTSPPDLAQIAAMRTNLNALLGDEG